jgi:DNA-binding MarR family transcriptional regulator
MRLGELVEEVSRCCQDRLLAEARLFDLPPTELRALLVFGQDRYLTPKGLAAALDLTKGRITKILEGLLKRDLVEQVDDPSDGRIKLLRLTPAGRRKMDEIKAHQNWIFQRVMGNMEPVQRTTVLSALELLRAAMEAARAEFGLDHKSK